MKKTEITYQQYLKLLKNKDSFQEAIKRKKQTKIVLNDNDNSDSEELVQEKKAEVCETQDDEECEIEGCEACEAENEGFEEQVLGHTSSDNMRLVILYRRNN